TRPRPMNWPHIRLTIARLKYGFFAVVSQSARTGRTAPVSTLGVSPPRNLGGSILADSGSAFLPRRGLSVSVTLLATPFLAACCGGVDSTFMKNAAMPQYSVCFHSVNGWLWHWAHWSWTPRNNFVTSSVILSTEPLATKKVTAPFFSVSPVAVSRSWTMPLQGWLRVQRSSSHLPIGSLSSRRLSLFFGSSSVSQMSARCLP